MFDRELNEKLLTRIRNYPQLKEWQEPEIRMGSLASLEAWAGKISRGEGLGKILGKGYRGIAAEFGEETRRSHCRSNAKGLDSGWNLSRF